MGNGRFNSTDWDTYVDRNVSGRSQAQVFTAKAAAPAYVPTTIDVRESRDGTKNPESTAIILACDVTGSMGMVSDALMRGGLITLATQIYDRKPVTDPHIMVMAVGDAKTDRAPLQATQFEADIVLADQVKALWLEGNGGGNGGESYSAAHLFAGMKTSIDCFEKRGRKGYLFTIGDEPVHDGMTKAEITKVLGIEAERGMSARECIDLAMRTYEVFHIVLAREGYAQHGLQRVLDTWKPLLPERTILLEDYTKLAEVVVSAIQVNEGANRHTVANSWSGNTSVVVANALKDLGARNGGRGVRQLA